MRIINSALTAALVAVLFTGALNAGAPRKIVNYAIDASSQSALYIDNAGVLGVPAGLVTIHETITAPPTCSTIAYLNMVVSTTQMVSAGTTTVSFLSQPVYPSALSFVLYLDTRSFDTSVYAGQYSTVTIRGIDAQGYNRTERIAVSTHMLTSNYAYSSISSMTFSPFATAFAGSSETSRVYINVGSTATYGLANDISTFTYAVQHALLHTSTVTGIPRNYTLLDAYSATSAGSTYGPNATMNSGVAGAAVPRLTTFTGLAPVYKVIEGNINITSATFSPAFGTYKPTTQPNGTVIYHLYYNVLRGRRPKY
jgi:hypothetical protein